MDILIQQEIALHQSQNRRNKSELTRLLHPDFRETGSSGNSYDFNSISRFMTSEEESDDIVHAQDFEAIPLSEGVYLLLYRSCYITPDGTKRDFAKRSSVWINTYQGWQIQYHQGTPCAEFLTLTMDGAK